MPMHSWSKIIVACLILLFSSVYSIALADEADEQKLQKLENLLEIYIKENRELKQKIQNLEVTTDTVINKPANEIQEQLNRTTSRARCEANLKNCSKAELCELSTYKIGSKPRGWKVGVYRKFVAEAKRRGLTCGVKTVNSSTNQTAAVSTTKTARDRCEANLQICSKAELCELSTYKIGSKPRDWKVGVYRKFVAEAKRRGLTCGVKTVNSSTNQTAAVSTTKTARDRCEADLVFCNEAVLCELATYGPLGNTDWKVGVYRKFVAEAKRRGLTCGVKTVNSSTNQTAAVSTTKTARDRCEADLVFCNEAVLCELATYGPLGNTDWKVGVYRKFADEAKRRGLTCDVVKDNSTYKPKPSKENSPKIKPQKHSLKLRYATTSCQSQSAWLLTDRTIGFADNRLLCPTCSVIVNGDLEVGTIQYILENDKARSIETFQKAYDARLDFWYWTRHSKIRSLRNGVLLQDKKENLNECK